MGGLIASLHLLFNHRAATVKIDLCLLEIPSANRLSEFDQKLTHRSYFVGVALSSAVAPTVRLSHDSPEDPEVVTARQAHKSPSHGIDSSHFAPLRQQLSDFLHVGIGQSNLRFDSILERVLILVALEPSSIRGIASRGLDSGDFGKKVGSHSFVLVFCFVRWRHLVFNHRAATVKIFLLKSAGDLELDGIEPRVALRCCRAELAHEHQEGHTTFGVDGQFQGAFDAGGDGFVFFTGHD